MTERELFMVRSIVWPGWGQFSQGRRAAGWTFLLAGLAVVAGLTLREALGIPALLAWLDVALVAAVAGWDARRAASSSASAR